MKTNFRILLGIAIFTFTVTSCSKEEGGDPEEFSLKSVEENKQEVENSAIIFANTMDDMKDINAIDAAISLGIKLDMADPFETETMKKSKISATICVVGGLQSGQTDVIDMFDVMKSGGELIDDPETIQELWDEIVGTYSWNHSMENWDYNANSDKVVFEFPSTEEGKTNDASLTIFNYAGVVISNPLDGEYEGDLPVSLEMELKVGNTTLMDFIFSSSYNSEGIPSKVAADLNIETFGFSVDLTNSNTEISANYSFTHNGTIIMELGGAVNGDFTQENIDENSVEYSDTWTWTDYVWNEATQEWEEIEVTETDTWTELDAEEIARSANAKFRLVDIAVKGEVDIKSLVDEMDQIYPEGYWDNPGFDWKVANEMEAAAFNKYLSLYAYDVSENKKIAEAEAYVVQDSHDGYVDYWMDLRLKFGDGSYIDLETYTEEGFADFVNEINAMLTELNGEYDWDLELVEY